MNHRCKICGNIDGNIIYNVKERILNKGDVFAYLHCAHCGTLMLNEPIEDMSRWYAPDYNPFIKRRQREKETGIRLRNKLLVELIIHMKGKRFFKYIVRLENLDIQFKRLYGLFLSKKAEILDVGCATGGWLYSLYDMGWKHVTGIDLYCPEIASCDRKWKFISGDIFSIHNQVYDCITFNHSFEHMENPLEVLRKVYSLLSDRGVCIISIPLCGGISWKLFGLDYCQIHAPRHWYLYTPQSMKHLCDSAGLVLEQIYYDSKGGILHISDGYKKTEKSHAELCNFYPRSRKIKYDKIAEKANDEGNGDEAVFVIKKGTLRYKR